MIELQGFLFSIGTQRFETIFCVLYSILQSVDLFAESLVAKPFQVSLLREIGYLQFHLNISGGLVERLVVLPLQLTGQIPLNRDLLLKFQIFIFKRQSLIL